MKTCSVEECDGPLYCKGMCRLHYERHRKTFEYQLSHPDEARRKISKTDKMLELKPTPEELKTLVALHKAIEFILLMFEKK